jgi:hypothetical protein
MAGGALGIITGYYHEHIRTKMTKKDGRTFQHLGMLHTTGFVSFFFPSVINNFRSSLRVNSECEAHS